MSSPLELGRVFFASIPKCGKNIIYTFLHGLGLTRPTALEIDRELAALYTYSKYFPDLDVRGTYAFPPVAAKSMELRGMNRFLAILATLPDGTALNHHFAFDEELLGTLRQAGVPAVFVCRDPRDCLLSMANYILHRSLPAHLALKMGHLPLEKLLTLLLEGDRELIPFGPYFDCFKGWMNAEGVLTLRFEDIIGPRGGGLESVQIDALSALAAHIGWRGPSDVLKRSILNAFSPSVGTFYKGQIGAWREAFSESIRTTFEQEAGHLLTSWGYGESGKEADRFAHEGRH